MATIGLLHPGEMGGAIGAVLVGAGHRVLWCEAGRSEATRGRARTAGLEDAGAMAELAASCDCVLSVCPPYAAADVAARVRDAGFHGLYIDANAIAPETARTLERDLAGKPKGKDGSIDLVDGGIIGPPPVRAGLTRLYLSGARGTEVAAWFAGTNVEAVVVEGGIGAASALKMVYAGWTKGTTALLAAVVATARAEGVEADLLREWGRSVPDLERRVAGLPGVTRKAWRFEGEMREIAATFEAAGLPAGFHQAAADVYARLAELAEAADEQPPLLDALLEHLTKQS